jgi:hypothetical protein
MPKYEVIIQTEGHEVWEVEADSEEDALVKVRQGEGDQTNSEANMVDQGEHEATLIDEADK